MNFKTPIYVSLFVLTACGQPDSDPVEQSAESAAVVEDMETVADAESMQITEGLSARILREGEGEAAEAGQIAVVAYLAEHGINPARLHASGAGSDEPIASNEDAAGRQVNRRIEFELSFRRTIRGATRFSVPF